jgi:hypothetical protein
MHSMGVLPTTFPGPIRQLPQSEATNNANLFDSNEDGKEEVKIETQQGEKDRGDQGSKATSTSGKLDGKKQAK